MTVKPGCTSFCQSTFRYYLYFCLISCFSCFILFVNCTFYVIPSKTNASSGRGTAYPSGEREFTPVFSGIRVTSSLILCVMFCRSLFVLLSFFIWPLCCLSFDLRILITPWYLQTLLTLTFVNFLSLLLQITWYYLQEDKRICQRVQSQSGRCHIV